MHEQLYWEDAVFIAFLAVLYWKWILYELRMRLAADLPEATNAVLALSEATAVLPRNHTASMLTAESSHLLDAAARHAESGSDRGVIDALELLGRIRNNRFFAKEALKLTL